MILLNIPSSNTTIMDFIMCCPCFERLVSSIGFLSSHFNGSWTILLKLGFFIGSGSSACTVVFICVAVRGEFSLSTVINMCACGKPRYLCIIYGYISVQK